MKQPYVVLDVQSPAEFKEMHVKDSINVSREETSLTFLQKYRMKKHIVVVGRDMETASKFASFLIQHQFPFVSTLHGGLAVVRADAPQLLAKR